MARNVASLLTALVLLATFLGLFLLFNIRHGAKYSSPVHDTAATRADTRSLQLISQQQTVALPLPEDYLSTIATANHAMNANGQYDAPESAIVHVIPSSSSSSTTRDKPRQQHRHNHNHNVLHNHDPNNLIFTTARAEIEAFAEEVNSNPTEVRNEALTDSNSSSNSINSNSHKWREYSVRLKSGGGVLPKLSVSPRNRLLFVMGLEGSGHHAFSAMMKVCNDSNLADSVWALKQQKEQQSHHHHQQQQQQHHQNEDNQHSSDRRFCEPAVILSRLLMHFDFRSDVVKGLYGAVDTNRTLDYIKLVEVAMKRLAEAPGENLFFLGMGFVRGSGMMSYPNYNAQHKALDHPDVFSLALMAESVGLDLRVVVLQRSGYEIISSTVKREFGNGASEGKILVDNAAAMLSQLQLLDHRFFMCIPYKQLGNLTATRAAEVAQFIHPTNLYESGVFRSMLDMVQYSSSNSRTSVSPSVPSTTINSNESNNRKVSAEETFAEALTDRATNNNAADSRGGGGSISRSRSRSLLLMREVHPTSDSYHAFHLHAHIQQIQKVCDSPADSAH